MSFAQNSRTFRQILSESATPFFVFSVSLALMLLATSVTVLPRLTRISVQGTLLSPPELERYAGHVRAEIGTLEQRVDAFVYPSRDPVYLHVRNERFATVTPYHVRVAIDDAVSRVPDARGAVDVRHIALQSDGTALIEGVVQNVGPRSMTVLASFVDALRMAPMVREVAPSAFRREDDPSLGPISPFSLQLSLAIDVP